MQERYSDTKCYVLHLGKITEEFEVQKEVRQGSMRSPISFLLVIGDVLYDASSGGDGQLQ